MAQAILMTLFSLTFMAFSLWCVTWADGTGMQAFYGVCAMLHGFFAVYWIRELVTGDL